jgi:endonuclease G
VLPSSPSETGLLLRSSRAALRDLRSRVRSRHAISIGGTTACRLLKNPSAMLRYLAVLLAVPAIASADPRSAQPASQAPIAGSSTTHVVGGTNAPPGKWPDAVAVLGPKGSCTGTLIAPDVVLTAGHCAEIEPSQIVANAVDYTSHDAIRVGVKSTTAYPSWQSSYDVSVIVLDQPITSITPRMLGTSCTFRTFTKQMDVHLVGFGLTTEEGTGDNTHLNEAMAPVVDPECMGPYGCVHAIQPGGEFVAGGGGTDSCFGDSGGPVYLDTPHGVIAIGAVSRGVNGSQMPCGSGGIYVRTDKIIDWIEQTTGRTIAKDDCGLDANTASADNAPPGAGCSATHGGAGLGLALGLLALRRRRR